MKKFQVNNNVVGYDYDSELILNGKKIFATKDINIQAFRQYPIRSIGFWENAEYKERNNTIIVGAGFCCDGAVYILRNYSSRGEWILSNALHTEVTISSMLPISSRYFDLMVMGNACNGSGIRVIRTENHRHYDSQMVIEGLYHIMSSSCSKVGRPVFSLGDCFPDGLPNIFIKGMIDKNNQEYSEWKGMAIDDLLRRQIIDFDLKKTIKNIEGFQCLYF